MRRHTALLVLFLAVWTLAEALPVLDDHIPDPDLYASPKVNSDFDDFMNVYMYYTDYMKHNYRATRDAASKSSEESAESKESKEQKPHEAIKTPEAEKPTAGEGEAPADDAEKASEQPAAAESDNTGTTAARRKRYSLDTDTEDQSDSSDEELDNVIIDDRDISEATDKDKAADDYVQGCEVMKVNSYEGNETADSDEFEERLKRTVNDPTESSESTEPTEPAKELLRIDGEDVDKKNFDRYMTLVFGTWLMHASRSDISKLTQKMQQLKADQNEGAIVIEDVTDKYIVGLSSKAVENWLEKEFHRRYPHATNIFDINEEDFDFFLVQLKFKMLFKLIYYRQQLLEKYGVKDIVESEESMESADMDETRAKRTPKDITSEEVERALKSGRVDDLRKVFEDILSELENVHRDLIYEISDKIRARRSPKDFSSEEIERVLKNGALNDVLNKMFDGIKRGMKKLDRDLSDEISEEIRTKRSPKDISSEEVERAIKTGLRNSLYKLLGDVKRKSDRDHSDDLSL